MLERYRRWHTATTPGGIIGTTPIFFSLYRSYSTDTEGSSDTTHTVGSWSRALRHCPACFRRFGDGRGRTMRQSLITLLGTTAVLIALAGNLRAQENLPLGPENYESDLQIFAPFNLDLDNMAESQQTGYFFEYNKLYWNLTGERTTVGSSNVSETITWFNGVNTQQITATNGVFAETIY